MPNSQGAQFTMVDSSREKSNFGFTITAVTAVNLAGQLTAMTALETAIVGITTGEFTRKQMDVYNNTFLPVTPTDPACQKENKWLVRYNDETTGKVYRMEIPTADLTLLPADPAGGISEYLDLSVNPGLAFKTAFEGIAQSPDVPANEINVLSVQFVGRG